MIKCPNCAGEVQFNPKLQQVECKYCGSLFSPEELSEKLKAVSEKAVNDFYEGKTYTCSQCGATLMTFDDTAITFCSYCGSQAMLEDKMLRINNPDFIIPFQKTKEECVEAYKQKVSKFLFAPNDMKESFVVDKFRGIYMPYVIYDLKKDGVTRNLGSKYAYRRGDYVYYHDYQIVADVDISYEGISYDLVSKFYDNYSTAIPFRYQDAITFRPGYLAGYYADALDVNETVYVDTAMKVIAPDVGERLKHRKEFRKFGCQNPKVLFQNEQKIGMFPVYFLAIRDKNNQKVSYAVVNGQTGKVAVDLPIDFRKYIFGSLLLSVVIFLLIQSFLVLTPASITAFSIITALLSLVISIHQNKKIDIRQHHKDDKGVIDVLRREYIRKRKESLLPDTGLTKEQKLSAQLEKKNQRKRKLKFLYKEILAIIIPLVILFSNLASDLYYYGAAIISLLLVILSFYDLVREHNLLVSNPLPQFEKRGGDENG